MQGRYGYDELSRFLIIAGLVLMIVSCLPYLHFLYILGFAAALYSWLRVLSKNYNKRRKELDRYLSIKYSIAGKIRLYKSMWRDRKTHKYCKCPDCKAVARIARPEKGKRILIACPKCGRRFENRT